MSNDQNTLDQNILRQVFFILIILSLGLLLFFELRFFLPAVLGSLTLYILMRERMHYLTEVKKWSKPRAAWLLMVHIPKKARRCTLGVFGRQALN